MPSVSPEHLIGETLPDLNLALAKSSKLQSTSTGSVYLAVAEEGSWSEVISGNSGAFQGILGNFSTLSRSSFRKEIYLKTAKYFFEMLKQFCTEATFF